MEYITGFKVNTRTPVGAAVSDGTLIGAAISDGTVSPVDLMEDIINKENESSLSETEDLQTYNDNDIEFNDGEDYNDEEESESVYSDTLIDNDILRWKKIELLAKIRSNTLRYTRLELDILSAVPEECDKLHLFESTMYFKYFIDKELYYNNDDEIKDLMSDISYYKTIIKTGSIFTTLVLGYTSVLLLFNSNYLLRPL